jgi:hypothetical protein
LIQLLIVGFTNEVVHYFAVGALDLEAPAWAQGMFLDFLQQARAANAPHFLPADLARGGGRWLGGHNITFRDHELVIRI